MRAERWFVAWMILAGLALGVLLVLAMLAADELREIAAGMKEAGVSGDEHPALLQLWQARDNQLKIEAAKVNRAAQDKRERANAAARAA